MYDDEASNGVVIFDYSNNSNVCVSVNVVNNENDWAAMAYWRGNIGVT